MAFPEFIGPKPVVVVAIDVGREDVKRPGVARDFEGFRWNGIEGLVALSAGALLQHGPAPQEKGCLTSVGHSLRVGETVIFCAYTYRYIYIYTHKIYI